MYQTMFLFYKFYVKDTVNLSCSYHTFSLTLGNPSMNGFKFMSNFLPPLNENQCQYVNEKFYEKIVLFNPFLLNAPFLYPLQKVSLKCLGV